MSDTIDALDTLIHSEGWRVICEAARREWTERERSGVKAVVSGDEQDAISKLRQIVAAREAVEWVITLPGQEIARLRRQQAASASSGASHSARSAVPELVAAMSRRGSL